MYSYPNFESVHCFMSSSNCGFLSCIHASQETGKVVSYSHLFKNFPQFVVIHKVKGFSIINEAEVDVFGIPFFFFCDPMDVGNLISGLRFHPYWAKRRLKVHWFSDMTRVDKEDFPRRQNCLGTALLCSSRSPFWSSMVFAFIVPFWQISIR